VEAFGIMRYFYPAITFGGVTTLVFAALMALVRMNGG